MQEAQRYVSGPGPSCPDVTVVAAGRMPRHHLSLTVSVCISWAATDGTSWAFQSCVHGVCVYACRGVVSHVCCPHGSPGPCSFSGRASGAVGAPCPKSCRASVCLLRTQGCSATVSRQALPRKPNALEPTWLSASCSIGSAPHATSKGQTLESPGHTEALPRLPPLVGSSVPGSADSWLGKCLPEAALYLGRACPHTPERRGLPSGHAVPCPHHPRARASTRALTLSKASEAPQAPAGDQWGTW